MYRKTYYATHPGSVDGASNEELGERYHIPGLFAEGELRLNYLHYERFVIGGGPPAGAAPPPPPGLVGRGGRPPNSPDRRPLRRGRPPPRGRGPADDEALVVQVVE